MSAKKLLNFASAPERNLRLLQRATVAVLTLCGVLTWTLISGDSHRYERTATIGDAAETPTPSSAWTSTSIQKPAPKMISDTPVFAVAQGIQGDTVRYYEAQTGRALSFNLRTEQREVISDAKTIGLVAGWWIPGQNKAINEIDNQRGAIQYRMHNYDTNETSPIGYAVSRIAVSPDGNSVVYADTVEGVSGIYTADSNGKNLKKILNTRTPESDLAWPSRDVISFGSQRTDRAGADLSIINPDGWLQPLLTGKRGLEFVWSNNGQRLLASSFTKEGAIGLVYIDLANGTEVALNVATSAEKCAWSADDSFIVCGVPVKSSLTPDVPASRTATDDDIVVIRLSAGTQERVYQSKNNTFIGVVHPLISSSGRYVVFTNVFNQKLYVLPL